MKARLGPLSPMYDEDKSFHIEVVENGFIVSVPSEVEDREDTRYGRKDYICSTLYEVIELVKVAYEKDSE